MSETKSTGPRTRQEATAQVARYLIRHLAQISVDEMTDLNRVKMTDTQFKRLEAAAADITARLRKLAGE